MKGKIKKRKLGKVLTKEGVFGNIVKRLAGAASEPEGQVRAWLRVRRGTLKTIQKEKEERKIILKTVDSK